MDYNMDKINDLKGYINSIEDIAYNMNPEFEDEAERIMDLYYFVNQIRNIINRPVDITNFF